VLATETLRPNRIAAESGHPHQGGEDGVDDGARHGDVPHPPQIREGEVEPHPEQEEDDAQLRHLPERARVADEAGSERPDGDPGQQVAQDGGQSCPPGGHPAQKRHDQGGRDGDEKGRRVHPTPL